jgi:phosphoribosylpyrophosphate synthetase
MSTSKNIVPFDHPKLELVKADKRRDSEVKQLAAQGDIRSQFIMLFADILNAEQRINEAAKHIQDAKASFVALAVTCCPRS